MKLHIRCKWKTLALILGTLAAMLALALALSLGILLTSLGGGGCGEPPNASLAFWNFTGESKVGTNVALVCPAPLVFPDNSSMIAITCTKNLSWTPPRWLSCVRRQEQWCELETAGSLPLLKATVHLLDKGTDLSVEVMLKGELTHLMQLDLNTSDITKCYYGPQDNSPLQESTSIVPAMMTKTADTAASSVHFLKMQDSVVNPALPYEVRLRGVGSTVSLGLIQGSHVNVTIFRLQEEASATQPFNNDKHLFTNEDHSASVGQLTQSVLVQHAFRVLEQL